MDYDIESMNNKIQYLTCSLVILYTSSIAGLPDGNHKDLTMGQGIWHGMCAVISCQ